MATIIITINTITSTIFSIIILYIISKS
jgi:hypothetical protein